MQPRNPWLCVSIVFIIGLMGLTSDIGILWLSMLGKDPPQSLVAIGSGAMGALASFLVSVPRGSVGYDTQQTRSS